MATTGQQRWRVTNQISPIVLVGGIASDIPGGSLPIISITQAGDYDLGILESSTDVDLDQFFGHFEVAGGASLIENEVATYPFANQTVAANAIVTQPLRVSLVMHCPARAAGGFQTKLTTFQSLQAKLLQHSVSGGTYNVATPAYLYQGCLLTALRDVSGGDARQPQDRWQFDFMQPLLTQEQAQAAQNALMSKLSGGQRVTGDPPSYSGQDTNLGTPASLAGQSTVPAASSTGAAAYGSQGLNADVISV